MNLMLQESSFCCNLWFCFNLEGFKGLSKNHLEFMSFPIRISFFSYFVNESRILSRNPFKLFIHVRFSYSVLVSPKPSMEAENPLEAPISEKMFKSAPKIHSYANSGDFASVEKLLSRIRLKNKVIVDYSFIVVYRAYGKSQLPEKAVDLFHRMVDEFRCKRSVKSFNYVLNVIINEGLYHRGLEFYDYVLNSNMNMNISPNGLSFNLVIKALCKLGFVDRAIEVFRAMPEKKCLLDGYTYCTLMDWL